MRVKLKSAINYQRVNHAPLSISADNMHGKSARDYDRITNNRSIINKKIINSPASRKACGSRRCWNKATCYACQETLDNLKWWNYLFYLLWWNYVDVLWFNFNRMSSGFYEKYRKRQVISTPSNCNVRVWKMRPLIRMMRKITRSKVKLNAKIKFNLPSRHSPSGSPYMLRFLTYSSLRAICFQYNYRMKTIKSGKERDTIANNAPFCNRNDFR